MRICSKCNKDVTPGQLYCPKCGFSLIKNKYGERISVGGSISKFVTPEAAQKINASNITRANNEMQSKSILGNNKNTKTEPKIAVIAVVVFLISTFVPVLLTLFASVEITDEATTNTAKYSIDGVIEEVTTLANDNLSVRKYYAENGNISLSVIAEETSLEESDLTPAWCGWVENYNTEANAILCTITAHSHLSHDTNVLNALEDLNYSIINDYSDDVNYESLSNIYNTLDSLYYLSLNSYDTYQEYDEKYNSLIDNLNYYIENLE